MEIVDVIKKHAVQNRLLHGKANEKAVLGKVISEVPEARKNMKELLSDVARIVLEVNGLAEEELAGFEFQKRKTGREYGLKLPGNPSDVVMRFAPNPNGPATIGSARGIVVNSVLARKYEGKFILRFDDTDPKTKKPMLEAYDWYLDDCAWLGAEPDEVYYASERIPSYYSYAEKLIEMGHAYVCFCPQESFKALRDNKKECPHRSSPKEDNLALWRDMLAGKFKDGECVLRIKTDIKHKDPALRDWVAFRIIREDHPRIGKKYLVWPMLDFESAIEDHVLGVTHIIRGKDLSDSEHRQKYVYRYLDWEYPKTMHWGRVKVDEFGKFSTSKLKEGIAKGVYSGWDDPRIPTLRALRRRGISPEAVRNLMIGLGVSDADIAISLENLYAEDRKVMDPQANRYFFVRDPVEFSVKNAPETTVQIPLHPGFRSRGSRVFDIKPGPAGDLELFIPSQDAGRLKKGDIVRLMNLFNVRIDSVDKKVVAFFLEEKRLDVPKIHWVSGHIKADVVTPEGVVSGFCEPACENIKGDEVVQFERFGFARLDRKRDLLVFYLSHR